jgi:hypothetical protein
VTLANDPTRMISGNLLHDSSGSMPNHFDVVGVSHVSTIPSPWTPSPASWYDDRYSYVQHHPTIPLVRTAPPNNPPRTYSTTQQSPSYVQHHPTIPLGTTQQSRHFQVRMVPSAPPNHPPRRQRIHIVQHSTRRKCRQRDGGCLGRRFRCRLPFKDILPAQYIQG